MMTKREQVRTVRPYRTKNNTFDWEVFLPLRSHYRDTYGSITTDEQRDPFDEDELEAYFQKMYQYSIRNARLEIKELLCSSTKNI